MPFKSGDDPNRFPGGNTGGGRTTNAERERARSLVGQHKVLDRLAEAAGRKKPNVPAARLLLQVAGLLIEQVAVEPGSLEGYSDQELAARAETIREKVLRLRKRAASE